MPPSSHLELNPKRVAVNQVGRDGDLEQDQELVVEAPHNDGVVVRPFPGKGL